MLRYALILIVLVSAVGCSGDSTNPTPTEEVPKVIFVPVQDDSPGGKSKKADPVGSLTPIVPPGP
jgi:hypothetical protein